MPASCERSGLDSPVRLINVPRERWRARGAAAGAASASAIYGPKSGFQIEAAAEKADVKAELIRATDALGVRSQRGQWWWLPG
jgi:hypothetical protein